MPRNDFKRKIVAILSADAQDYSRLMGVDEAWTVRTIKAHFQDMTALIGEHRGRVVDSSGDNLLAEFASVVDAVHCAVEVQEKLGSRNGELPEDRRMAIRIGINLGDVIEEDGRNYGDGVNLAARIEQLAEGGEIFISGTAYDQVKNKLPLRYEYLGEQTVRNIAEPVRVYKVVPAAAGQRVWRASLKGTRMWRGVLMAAVPGLIVAALAAVLWNTSMRPLPSPVEVVVQKSRVPPVPNHEIEPQGAAPEDRKVEPRKAAPRGQEIQSRGVAPRQGKIEPGETAPQGVAEKPSGPSIPDDPSIAVLPFQNLSGDPEQEYLADGLVDDMITTLSKLPRLVVISKSSTLAYKGKPLNVREAIRELGVRYLLEGSVQRSGDRLRVNAQLIDGSTDKHIWSERYDRDVTDFFKARDELILDIATALKGTLTDGELAKISRRNTNSLEAWEAMQRGHVFYERYNPEDNRRALPYYRKATELDPKYVNPWMMIGFVTYMEARFSEGEARERGFDKALEIAEKVLKMDPSYYGSYTLFSWTQTKKGLHVEAVANARKAVELEPNNAHAATTLAVGLLFAGKTEEAIVQLQRALRLAPHYRSWLWHMLGLAHHMEGRYDKALETLKQGAARDPKSPLPHVWLAAVYADLGREEEMRAEAAEVLKLKPKFSADFHVKDFPFSDPKINERRKALLIKAGLPE